MKVKELIEELQRFNPDGVVYVTTIEDGIKTDIDCRVEEVTPKGCSMINPVIIASI